MQIYVSLVVKTTGTLTYWAIVCDIALVISGFKSDLLSYDNMLGR
jgi:hypothetical protein